MEQAFYYFYFYPHICGPNDPQLYSLLNFLQFSIVPDQKKTCILFLGYNPPVENKLI